ncbi:MAG: poly-gamma-glutamate biosynthesis protein PgsC/CapC [Acidobacteria bacterium]|nr:poly-gamma-glutamate biosynthesis protein PgsC/CapC [Acidobacteriota bacterium]MCA1638850.1 poly-gamma-glutamate biosynthesis protein PgsC/CapC [Acidobacteriota bacterium]
MSATATSVESDARRNIPQFWIILSLIACGLLLVGFFLASSIHLPLFYENGLAHSVLPPVLIGVIILTLGSELFGWTYSGLLVPGFLVTVIIVEPWAGFLMVVEALCTYGLVLVLSSLGAWTGAWSEFFGRDRFLAILLASVGVRLLIEGSIVDNLGLILNENFTVSFDYRHKLFSVGFVCVPLLANMVWNAGLRKALTPITVSMFVTYLVTLYFLIDHTNYSAAYLSLLFEGAAIDFTASPKAHIILLTCAMLASRANLNYGWDFNGILVPALLSLIWITPVKLVATLLEAVIILFVAQFISSRKRFETTTIEGPRKTLLLFSISFLLKTVIDPIVAFGFPGVTSVDFYGFGYLLPTLMAAKMWERGSVILYLVPTLRISLAGVIIGNLIAFSLTLIPLRTSTNEMPSVSETIQQQQLSEPQQNLYATLMLSRARLRMASKSNPVDYASASELDRFNAVYKLINSNQGKIDQIDEKFRQAADFVKPLGYEGVIFRNEQQQVTDLLLRETGKSSGRLRGWGMFLFSAEPKSDLIIHVPFPVAENASLEAGLLLYRKLGAKALIVSGTYQSRISGKDSWYVSTGRSPLESAYHYFSKSPIIDARVDGNANARLAVKGGIPDSLDLAALRELAGDFNIDLNPDFTDSQWAGTAQSDFLELRLPPEAVMRGAVALFGQNQTPDLSNERKFQSANLRFYDWLDNLRKELLETKTAFREPSREELVFFDERLFTPLLRSSNRALSNEELGFLQLSASIVGYKISVLQENGAPQQYVALTEQRSFARRWGTFVFKTGAPPSRLFVEVPHARREQMALRFGMRIVEPSKVQALFIGETEQGAGSTSVENDSGGSLLNLAHQRCQTTVPEKDAQTPPLTLQMRSVMTPAEQVGADIVITTGIETPKRELLPPRVASVLTELEQAGYRVRLYDGSKERAQFTPKADPQRSFSESFSPGSFAVLYIPRARQNREGLSNTNEHTTTSTHAAAIGLEQRSGSLSSLLAGNSNVVSKTKNADFTNLTLNLQKYGEFRNINDLRLATNETRQLGFRPLYFYDSDTGQSFFLLRRGETAVEVLRIGQSANAVEEVSMREDIAGDIISRYIIGNAARLSIRP